jgi:hypothetical protein
MQEVLCVVAGSAGHLLTWLLLSVRREGFHPSPFEDAGRGSELPIGTYQWYI